MNFLVPHDIILFGLDFEVERDKFIGDRVHGFRDSKTNKLGRVSKSYLLAIFSKKRIFLGKL